MNTTVSRCLLIAVILFANLANSIFAAESAEPTPGQLPPLPSRPPEGIPAFPGAWGGGIFTTGGRGGKVIAVTNLNDSGKGSLREAIAATGPRIIVFRVAGIIDLKSNLDINNPDITIAGQSAPGDGICLAHASLNINTRNVIVRHLRVRRGMSEGGQGSDNIGGNPIEQVVVDHCSTSWGMDENLSLYRYMKPEPDGTQTKLPVMNLTVQYCITSEALNAKNHAFGGTWGGEDSTFHHNLFACNTGRNPSVGMGGEFDFRNNVVFNWKHRTMDGGDETSLMNVINNYYKPGPATNEDMRTTIVRIEERDMYSPGRRFEPGGWYPKGTKRPGKWYVAGNYFDGSPDITADNWLAMKPSDEKPAAGSTERLRELARVETPFEAWPIKQQTAQEAFEAVLKLAGATQPKRDSVDVRVTEMVRTGKTTTKTGVVESIDQVGGYPEYKFDPAAVPADSDNDGMSDEWEQSYNVTDGAADTDGDGYTNVEEFLNGTDPQEKIDYTNLGNNIDTISG
jgi:pectate lyase